MNEEQTKPLPDEDVTAAEQDVTAAEQDVSPAEQDVSPAEQDVSPAEAGVQSDEPAAEALGPRLRGDDEAARGDDETSRGDDETSRGNDETALEPAPLDLQQVKRVLEAALLSTTEPLTVQQLKRLFGGEVDADTVRKVLDELKGEWAERSIELTSVASGWRFRVKPEYQKFLDRISAEKPPRYSRAVLETLAIIAYRQPVTRGDIEEVRGVAVSPPTLKALEERGWIETIGHRETPGRPALFATTKKFLDDLNLRSLEELPPLDELQAALEPAPTLVPIEAAPPPPEQDTLIDEADTPELPESHDESQQTPAG